MDFLSLFAGLIAGFIMGSGAVVFYMRWKMKKQLNAMQQNMDGMFNMTEDLMGDLEDAEAAEVEEVEEKEKGEEKE